MRRALIAGNWKMNGTLDGARALAGAVVNALPAGLGAEVALCPPFVFLLAVGEVIAASSDSLGVSLGAQNVSDRESGAYTGEVGASMLADLGCRYVLVGHSERRALYADSDDQVAAKFERVQAAGLRPILCIGETLAERDEGDTEKVVARQLDAVISRCADSENAMSESVIAYEPVWAIGTGHTATPEQAQAVHEFIRGRIAGYDEDLAVRTRILYGGSVKGGNAASLFDMPDIDGGLIGGASLDAAEFIKICTATV